MDTDIDLIEKEINKNQKPKYVNKKLWIIFSVLSSIFILAILVTILLTKEVIFNIKFDYEIIQSDTGFQYVLVNWTSNETFNITINVKGVENEVIRTYNIFNTNQSEQYVKVYYGTPKLNIIIKKGGDKNEKNEEFYIPAKEVLIAAFHASLPVLIFSFDFFNIRKNFNYPIYVSLERYEAWEWNKLPERIFIFDILDENNFNINFDAILNKLKKWIEQMFKVNNKVKINLFITDVHNFIIPLCIYSNNIPSDNYNVYLLSDGTGSYSTFNEKFDNNETYINTYNQMKNKYKEFKNYVWNRKRYDKNSNAFKNIRSWELFSYSYIIVKEEKNVFWWLTKIKGAFAPNNPALLEELLNNTNIALKDLNILFKSLNNEHKEQLKNLFNFNSNFFEEAYRLNRSVMLIAGTNDNTEYNLYDYCLTIESFYKNDYIYYYKAHPGTPIENNQKKIDNLKKINVTPIDSNIPLEVIMFFNPNVFCSGYYTSSFIEIDKENLKALFGQYKKEDEYFNKFDFFCQYIKKDNEKYGKYLGDNGDGIVLEINNIKLVDFDYDFGIYLKNNNSVKYYKYKGNNF